MNYCTENVHRQAHPHIGHDSQSSITTLPLCLEPEWYSPPFCPPLPDCCILHHSISLLPLFLLEVEPRGLSAHFRALLFHLPLALSLAHSSELSTESVRNKAAERSRNILGDAE
ncbi:hypothetical protein MHYP_G00220700 [Metynnis hypsauchen]